ncbi:MAG: class I SAM-dependent DNA methyltransferase [Paracoccaceae bacterium]
MKKVMDKLYARRTVEETVEIYRDWAAGYDAEVQASGYVTPARVAAALRGVVAPDAEVLDFGCGTGLSGLALRAEGFERIDGCDITAEMLERARETGAYRELWEAAPDDIRAPRTYAAINAAGVVSMGAGPPEVLDLLVEALPKGGILSLSFNQSSLEDGGYDAELDRQVAAGRVSVLSRESGPGMTVKGTSADVIVLRRE